MRIEYWQNWPIKRRATKTDQLEFSTAETDRVERSTTKYWAIRQCNGNWTMRIKYPQNCLLGLWQRYQLISHISVLRMLIKESVKNL